MKILKIYYGPGIVAACSQPSQAATVDLTTPWNCERYLIFAFVNQKDNYYVLTFVNKIMHNFKIEFILLNIL